MYILGKELSSFTLQGGGIPRRSAPILQMIREEVS